MEKPQSRANKMMYLLSVEPEQYRKYKSFIHPAKLQGSELGGKFELILFLLKILYKNNIKCNETKQLEKF